MKYTVGLLAGQLSGKAGNTVASRNRNGSYFRTRVNPMVVRNIYTTSARDLFTSNSQRFRELAWYEIKTWNDLGAQMIRSNSIGQSSGMTGLQAFLSVNNNLTKYWGTSLNAAPEIGAAPSANGTTIAITRDVDFLTTTVTTGATSETQLVGSTAGVTPGDIFSDIDTSDTAVVVEVIDATHVLLDTVLTTVTADDVHFIHPVVISVDFVPDPVPAGNQLVLFMTAPLSAGVTRPPKSAFRYVSGAAAGASAPALIRNSYINKFGSIPVGTKVFFRAFYVTDTGFAGTPYEDVCYEA